MTTAKLIWPHTEAMTWTATSLRHESVDYVTQHDYNVTTSTVLLAPDVTPSQWELVRFLVIVVASLLSNLLVVVTIKRSPRLQSMVYFYLSSLAIMDILDSLIVMPVAFARSLLNEFVIFSGWCQCWQTVLFGLACGTLVHIIMGTLHCYLMLGTPLRYHKYSQSIHAILQVSMGWVFPALLSVPAIVVLVTKPSSSPSIPGWDCAPADASYMSAALLPMYYFPVIIAVVLLVLLALKVKRQGHMSDQLQYVLPGLAQSNGIVHPITEGKGKETIATKPPEKKSCQKSSGKRRFKKPVTNVASTCTMASEYSQGTSDDGGSISDIQSQDFEEDDSLGKDKDMLIAEVHATKETETDPNEVDNTQQGLNQEEDIQCPVEDVVQCPSPLSSDYENVSSGRSSEAGSDTDSCGSQAKGKCGKEKLNEPLDDMDVHLTLETVELLNKDGGLTGSDNLAYNQDESETPLADSIQVKHKPECEEAPEETNQTNSQESSCGESEPGECGIKGPRRSILRRDGSRRVSKKVQFAIPESQSNEGKSANRIRRRPTGLRRRTRNNNVVNALNNGTVKHISNGAVTGLSMITNGVTTVPPSTFEYMMQVQRNQGLKLSRKVRSNQAHFAVLCAMLLANGVLSLPYMFSYSIMTMCHSCRSILPNNVATAFEWMHHASSAVNLLLYVLFNAEFRESLANLCG